MSDTPKYAKRTGTEWLVVHCADTTPDMNIGAKEIREWHTKERGWIDIGYHKVIRRDGTIEDGRPLWSIGAHVEGYNARSVAVCLVGGRGKDGWENNFTPAQLATLKDLLTAWGKIWPNAQIRGHRDFPNVTKKCPSFDVRQWWLKA